MLICTVYTYRYNVPLSVIKLTVNLFLSVLDNQLAYLPYLVLAYASLKNESLTKWLFLCVCAEAAGCSDLLRMPGYGGLQPHGGGGAVGLLRGVWPVRPSLMQGLQVKMSPTLQTLLKTTITSTYCTGALLNSFVCRRYKSNKKKNSTFSIRLKWQWNEIFMNYRWFSRPLKI